jgi:hypothetical protein
MTLEFDEYFLGYNEVECFENIHVLFGGKVCHAAVQVTVFPSYHVHITVIRENLVFSLFRRLI